MEKQIYGIQQIGIGVSNVQEAATWYRKNFGMDIKVFEDSATAELMTRYTGGEAHKRTAILSLNMKGGGGFEIWQYTSRTPVASKREVLFGDLGINACKIKSIDVQATYNEFKSKGLNIVTPLAKNPEGELNFFVRDPYGNLFHIVKGQGWFKTNTAFTTGGVAGAVIGCTDIEKARALYSDVIGYDTVVYDSTDSFEDYKGLHGKGISFRRVLLRHGKTRVGGFSEMFGPTEIELIQVIGREPNYIFEDRYWGDLGFIHLCFDVNGMDALGKESEAAGFPFTVDSANSFDMGEAAGRFTYVEDPDKTWIEFVETHKVPIIKKIGWYINMTKRDPKKNLPRFVVNGLSFSRVKE